MWFVWLLAFMGALIALVMIHELGHFTFAKFAKMHVAEFSIGFGPIMYQKVGKETTFSIRWIPLGGYVAVLSDRVKQTIESAQQAGIQDWETWDQMKKQAAPFDIDKDFSNERTYDDASWAKKSMFITAGVFFNYLVGVVILLFIYGIHGEKTLSDQTYVTEKTGYVNSSNTLNKGFNFHYASQWEGYEIIIEGADETTPKEYLPSIWDERFLIEDASGNWQSMKSIGLANPGIIEFEDFTIDNVFVPTKETKDQMEIPKAGEPVESNNNIEYSSYLDMYSLLSDRDSNGNPKYRPSLLKPTTIEWSDQSYITFDATNKEGHKYSLSFPSSLPLSDEESIVQEIPPLVATKKDGIYKVSYSYYSTIGVIYNNGAAIVEYVPMSAGQVIGRSLSDVFVLSIEMFLIVGQVFVTEPLSENFGVKQVDANGVDYFKTPDGAFYWMVLLTSNLMLFNFLPFPPLDGYKFVEATYEEVSKKKVPRKTERVLGNIGKGLTFAFFILLLLG